MSSDVLAESLVHGLSGEVEGLPDLRPGGPLGTCLGDKEVQLSIELSSLVAVLDEAP